MTIFLKNMTDISSVILQKTARPIQCPRCAHKWYYTGKNEYIDSCPHCRTTVSIKKYARSQTGLSFGRPWPVCDKMLLTTFGVIQDMTASTLLENKDYVTKCLTDECNQCTGSYINAIIQHRLICKCKCHVTESNVTQNK
jgi:hypothetical protein